jgi:hypothetical protein
MCTFRIFDNLCWMCTWVFQQGYTVFLELFIQNVIGRQACWFISKIRMRLATSGATVAMQRRALNRPTKLKKNLCISMHYRSHGGPATSYGSGTENCSPSEAEVGLEITEGQIRLLQRYLYTKSEMLMSYSQWQTIWYLTDVKQRN